MLSNYQLKIADFYNIPIDNVKNLVLFFLVKKSMSFIMKTLLKTRIELKKIYRLSFSRYTIHSITMVKTICRIQHTKENRSRKI